MGDGQLLRRYVYGPGVDEPICLVTVAGTYYYAFDGQGSVIALTDETGTEVETYTYGPFGETTSTSSLDNPYLYTARRFDSETGLYFNRARSYSPILGRFMQVDPIGYEGGMNLYAYAMNNPMMFIDPFGLCAEQSGWAANLANLWDESANQTEQVLKDIAYTSTNPFTQFGVAGLQASIWVGSGFVDMLRLGEGVAEGGWGYGQDALRLAGFLAPAAKVLRGVKVLPNSGPIPRSLGAMSRAEKLARKLKMNIESPTTRQVLNSLDDKVSKFVGKYRLGKIQRELPWEEVKNMTIEQALKHSTKVRKLLTDGRFSK